jgi:multiple sugar transport system permease protein
LADNWSLNQLSYTFAFGEVSGYARAWENLLAFQDGRILQWTLNSVINTGAIVVLSSITALLAGYALAATSLPFRRSLLITTLIAMIVPPVALIIPLFIEVAAVGLYDSQLAIILTSSFFPFGTFLAYIYFSSTIPRELYEAARVDGCGEFGTFMRVALPLSKGLLGMLAFFSFTAAWTNFYLPYVLVNSGEVLTLPVGLGVLFSSTPALNPGLGASILPIRQPEIALAGLLVALPVLLVFVASSRLLVRGLLAGSVKS